MTTLPEKDLLAGSKMPRTTTGEMKTALGKVRDYLAELFGEDSSDREAARKALGIDLAVLASGPETEVALSGKADRDELTALEEAMSGRGIPVGSIVCFAVTAAPAGYLIADGSAVGRETYPVSFCRYRDGFRRRGWENDVLSAGFDGEGCAGKRHAGAEDRGGVAEYYRVFEPVFVTRFPVRV